MKLTDRRMRQVWQVEALGSVFGEEACACWCCASWLMSCVGLWVLEQDHTRHAKAVAC